VDPASRGLRREAELQQLAGDIVRPVATFVVTDRSHRVDPAAPNSQKNPPANQKVLWDGAHTPCSFADTGVRPVSSPTAAQLSTTLRNRGVPSRSPGNGTEVDGWRVWQLRWRKDGQTTSFNEIWLTREGVLHILDVEALASGSRYVSSQFPATDQQRMESWWSWARARTAPGFRHPAWATNDYFVALSPISQASSPSECMRTILAAASGSPP
jgi:hypothetical protein